MGLCIDASEEAEIVEDVAEQKDDNSSEDEELTKWNLEDERKALELEMEGQEEEKSKKKEKHENSIDFTIHGDTKTSDEQEEGRKEEVVASSMQWDDSSSTVSSVLPAGNSLVTYLVLINHLGVEGNETTGFPYYGFIAFHPQMMY